MKMKKIISVMLSISTIISLQGCALPEIINSEIETVVLEEYVEEIIEESPVLITEDLEYPLNIRLATALPSDHPLIPLLDEFAKTVNEGTDGNVVVKVINNEILGGENNIVNKLEVGKVEMALAGSTVFGNKTPAAAAGALPFVFDDSDTAWNFVNDNIKKEATESFESYNIHYLTSLDNGYKVIFTSEATGPIKEAQDLEGKIIGTSGGHVALETLDDLYTTAIFTDTVGSLKSKVAGAKYSGIEGTIVDAYYNKYYNYTKFIALTDHSYETYVLAINDYIWTNMDYHYRDVINKAIKGMGEESHRIMTEEKEKCLSYFREYGMVVSDPQMALYFRHTAYDVLTLYVKTYSKDLRDTIVNYKRKSTLIIDEGESTIDDY